MTSLMVPIQRKPLFAPMLSTFGGGSVRGFRGSGGSASGLYDFTSFTFKNSGRTDSNAPYEVSGSTFISGAGYDTTNNSWLNDSDFYSVSNGLQTWTVPATATYRIECRGGVGTDSGSNRSSSWGSGARMRADFNLTEGDKFIIIVGVSGSAPGAGGGASCVMTAGGTAPTDLGYLSSYTSKRPLIVAGGGGADWSGSTGSFTNCVDEPRGNRAQDHNSYAYYGNGGATNVSSYGGGGGFYSGGSGSSIGADGEALNNTANGGDRGSTYFGTFGGGGAAIGGGGGYGGGAAGGSPYEQGGGGSFISSVTTGTGIGTIGGGGFSETANLRSGDSIWSGSSSTALGLQNNTSLQDGPKVIIEML